MSKMFAGVFATLGVLILLGIEVPGANLVHSVSMGIGLLLLAGISLEWSGIWDALTGDHREVIVGRDARWVPSTRPQAEEPPPGFFGRHPLEFGFEREDDNSLVVNGKPYYSKPADQPYMRDGRRPDGSPVMSRRPQTIIRRRG